MLKTCFKCSRELERSEFYRHPMMADGLLGKCKACTRRDVAEHRSANHAKVCAYDRARAKRPERKANAITCQRRRRVRNPEKNVAYVEVAKAVRDGRLRRQPCVYCGKLRVQAHHHDYSKPLDVEWACFRCHREHEHGGKVEEVGGAREGPVRPEDVPPGQLTLGI